MTSSTETTTVSSSRSKLAHDGKTLETMIRIELQIDLNYEIDGGGADFVFNIHAARTPSQSISAERLLLNQAVRQRMYTTPVTGNRYLYVHAEPGQLKLAYVASVDLIHHLAPPGEIAEVAVRDLPPEVISYIYPSRYCQSDRLIKLANNEFGRLSQGYSRVQAIQDWVKRHVTFTLLSSNTNTSAVDTLIEQVGVCRDFAHLMIALCRAVNIPARFATGTDYGADPTLGPSDFQAYVEVYLGHRWYIFDPSGTGIPMGFIRFGTGRDAADVSFATIFGGVRTHAAIIRAVAVDDPTRGFVLPRHCLEAISTDSGSTGATGSLSENRN
jgi:transglutaminase-like putative cysteine protease